MTTDQTSAGPIATRMLAVAILLMVGIPAFACPQETVTYPTFTLQTLSGRILPPDGDGLLPSDVEFIVRTRDGETTAEWVVPVRPDGEFSFALGEGSYAFTIKAKAYLFTLVGVVVISANAEKDERMKIQPSWC